MDLSISLYVLLGSHYFLRPFGFGSSVVMASIRGGTDQSASELFLLTSLLLCFCFCFCCCPLVVRNVLFPLLFLLLVLLMFLLMFLLFLLFLLFLFLFLLLSVSSASSVFSVGGSVDVSVGSVDDFVVCVVFVDATQPQQH